MPHKHIQKHSWIDTKCLMKCRSYSNALKSVDQLNAFSMAFNESFPFSKVVKPIIANYCTLNSLTSFALAIYLFDLI